jgi:hypothetical protein
MFSFVGTKPQFANVETIVKTENVNIFIPLFFSICFVVGIIVKYSYIVKYIQ